MRHHSGDPLPSQPPPTSLPSAITYPISLEGPNNLLLHGGLIRNSLITIYRNSAEYTETNLKTLKEKSPKRYWIHFHGVLTGNGEQKRQNSSLLEIHCRRSETGEIFLAVRAVRERKERGSWLRRSRRRWGSG
ncbi:hypothetical protein EVAR_29712_1 [Eumeta japonica]|uniref:Uncharacterized protein n=1 Tax=Eumeta variegata TaxID=151549 RepID=A0A4C1VY42_EUMVA|nr:hypothetical protein EVAR_29712_1 [Eumeta japonica]